MARQLGNMVEHPNQSQPNPGLSPDGTPCKSVRDVNAYLLSHALFLMFLPPNLTLSRHASHSPQSFPAEREGKLPRKDSTCTSTLIQCYSSSLSKCFAMVSWLGFISYKSGPKPGRAPQTPSMNLATVLMNSAMI